MSTMLPLQLVSHPLCPYVQRAAIVMAEKGTTPEYLLSHPKYMYWDVSDPKGTDLDQHRKTRDEIRQLIEENMELFG